MDTQLSISTITILSRHTLTKRLCTTSQKPRQHRVPFLMDFRSSSLPITKLKSTSQMELKRSCNIIFLIIFRFPDGTIKCIFADGEEESIFPDGTIQRIEKNGIKAIEFANGQKDILFPDGTRIREYPDGRIRKQYPNGTYETSYR